MHPTQYKLMKRIILFLSLQFPIAYPTITGQDIDLIASVKNSAYESGIDNRGNIDFSVAGVGYSSDNAAPKNYRLGGKKSAVTVSDYALQGAGDVLNQLRTDFRALSSIVATGSRQIFANETTTGAKSIGVVLFSIQDPTNVFNVISSTGNSRSMYPVTTSVLHNSSWKFYTRMRKIDPMLDIMSGRVMNHILVDVYYE